MKRFISSLGLNFSWLPTIKQQKEKYAYAKLFFSLFFVLMTVGVFAQNTIKQKYQYTIKGNIEMIEKAPGGYLLVGSSDGLSGIEAQTSNVKYTYTKMGKIKPEEMQLIPNTPYLALTRGYSKVIIDYTSGVEVFTQANTGWGAIMSLHPDLESNTMIVMGTRLTGGYALGVYDLVSFTEKGIVGFLDKKLMGVYINALNFYESDGKIFVRTEKGIVCIDKASLTINWVYSDLERTSSIIKVVADAKKGEYYIGESNGKDHYLHKIDANGALTSKKPTKLEGMPQRFELIDNYLFTHTADLKTTYFQLYDRSNAEKVWKDAYEVGGSIHQASITPYGIIYAAHKGEINTIDIATGNPAVKKDIKTGPTFKVFEILPNNQAFYLTTKDMGVVNLKTGEAIKEATKFKKVTNMITMYDEKNNRLVVSTGTELFFIKSDGDIKKVADVDFKENETPSKIELRESGILVGSAQSNTLFSYDGKVIYESYFKAPGQSLLGKVAMGAMAVALARQSIGENYAGRTKSANQTVGAANGMLGEMNKKFRATSGTKDHIYILTKLNDGVGLVKMNKNTGKVEAEIILDDKKPEYEVDEDYDVLYFKKEKNIIVGYDLK